MIENELTIGSLAARSGVATSALRFYEAEGLIRSDRTSGNQRRYPRATLRRVAFIQAGRRAGIPLRDIATALATLPHDRTPSKTDWARLSSNWQRDLQSRIDNLLALRDQFTSCIGCGCLSLRTCQLLNPDDQASGQGPGARYLPTARGAE